MIYSFDSAQINKYLWRIEQTPAREQDMPHVLREYQSTKEAYETIAEKKPGSPSRRKILKNGQKGEQVQSH